VAKRRSKRIYKYTCSLTNEIFKTTRKVDDPDELISLYSYYEMHPELDDRPEYIKKKAEVERINRIEKEEARLAAIQAAQEAAAARNQK
jgi:hypothetical protein